MSRPQLPRGSVGHFRGTSPDALPDGRATLGCMNERIPLAYLVPLRLFWGIVLVLEGWSKFQGDWLHGTPILRTLDGWIDAHKTYAFFMPIVQAARAHPKIFGTLVTVGELVIGGALVLGLLTRLASFLGAVMLLSFAF